MEQHRAIRIRLGRLMVAVKRRIKIARSTWTRARGAQHLSLSSTQEASLEVESSRLGLFGATVVNLLRERVVAVVCEELASEFEHIGPSNTPGPRLLHACREGESPEGTSHEEIFLKGHV